MSFATGRGKFVTFSELRRRKGVFNAFITLLVWSLWFLFGRSFALTSIIKNWQISLAMIFGSLVGGGTSEGGGAVSFPIFTKVLHIPPHDAMIFALACQSIGMGSASLTILWHKIPIESRILPFGALGGVLGIFFSSLFLVQHVPAPVVKVIFTCMVTVLAIALVLANRQEQSPRNLRCPIFGVREKLLIIVASLMGGILSGLVGCGENIATFMVLVLVFRVCEKIATPTTVLLMTIVTISGFGLHLLVLRDFTPVIQGYWLAAVPVVAVGAPLGALICSLMSRRLIVRVLIVLIAADFLSTILLIPLSHSVLLTAGLSLACFSILIALAVRTDYYLPTRWRSTSYDIIEAPAD